MIFPSGENERTGINKNIKSDKEFSHIPVIAVTAHAFEDDKQNALEAGCDSYWQNLSLKNHFLE